MFIVGLLSWWYGAGWKQRVFNAREQLADMYDYFSIDLLLRTLFSPFRQISAGSVQGPIGVQFRAWFDRLISRTIGMIVRSMMIVIGIITMISSAMIHGVVILLWAFVPIVPVLGVIIAMAGWIPWHI
jgi:hypothetical protein